MVVIILKLFEIDIFATTFCATFGAHFFWREGPQSKPPLGINNPKGKGITSLLE